MKKFLGKNMNIKDRWYYWKNKMVIEIYYYKNLLDKDVLLLLKAFKLIIWIGYFITISRIIWSVLLWYIR
jgi:hypothetical protein